MIYHSKEALWLELLEAAFVDGLGQGRNQEKRAGAGPLKNILNFSIFNV